MIPKQGHQTHRHSIFPVELLTGLVRGWGYHSIQGYGTLLDMAISSRGTSEGCANKTLSILPSRGLPLFVLLAPLSPSLALLLPRPLAPKLAPEPPPVTPPGSRSGPYSKELEILQWSFPRWWGCYTRLPHPGAVGRLKISVIYGWYNSPYRDRL